MTAEEKAFIDRVRGEVLDLVASFAACEKNITSDPRLATAIASRGGLAALALVGRIGVRLGQAELAVDQQQVIESGYDLAALATAPPPSISE